MSHSVLEERVVQIMRSLPDVRQQEILDFAAFLQTREKLVQPTADNLGFLPQMPRLVFKENVLVIETPPLGLGDDDVNQWIDDLREERIGEQISL